MSVIGVTIRTTNPALRTTRHDRWRAWRAPVLVLVAGLGLTLLGVAGLWWQGRNEDQRRFERECEEMWRSLQPRLLNVESWLLSARDFCERHVDASPAEFSAQWQSRIVGEHRLRDFLPGLYELGYAALETDGEVTQRSVKSSLYLPPDARVIVRERWLPGRRPIVKGDNLFVDDHSQTIYAAWNTGRVRTTGRTELVKSAAGMPRAGFRLYAPLYAEAHTKQAPKPRGVIFASFLPREFLRVHLGDEPRAIEFDIYAGSNPATRTLLTESVKGGQYERAIVPEAADPLRLTLVREAFGSTWSIDFRSTILFSPAASARLLAGIAMAGVVFSLLMCMAVRLQVLRRFEAEAARVAVELAESRLRREAEERVGLVRNLHDSTVQSLVAINAHLVRCADLAESGKSVALREELETAATDLDAAVAEVRDSLLRIGPATELEAPFSQAITDWLTRLNRGRDASLVYEADEAVAERLDRHLGAELTAIIREAVSNALRHGQAQRVIVGLRAEAGQGVLTVQDDGIGFAPRETAEGEGLRNLRQRARDLHGECLLESRAGGPTTLRVRFPLPAAAAASPPGPA